VALMGLATVVTGRLFGAIELYVAGTALVALVLLAWAAIRSRSVHLAISRTVAPLRVHVGDAARVELTVHNIGRRPTPSLRLADEVSGTRGASLGVAPLRPDAVVRAAYRLPTSRRGVRHIGPLTIDRTDVFALARRQGRAAGVIEVTVYPTVAHLPMPGARAGGGPLSEHLRLRALGREGEEFRSLRGYARGDDLRRVHWRASARTDDLLVRETDTQTLRRLALVLDACTDRHDEESFERAVSAAASVLVSATEYGYDVRSVFGDDAAVRSGPGILVASLDRLAVIEPGRDQDLVRQSQAASRWMHGGLLVVVTGRADGSLVNGLRAATGLVDGAVVIVTAGDPPAPSPGIFVADATGPDLLVPSWTGLIGGAGGATGARPHLERVR
jgi:uncharacterized protein (DUF58 family)